MAKPIFTLPQVIGQIDGGYHWSGTSVTYSIPATSPYPDFEGVGFEKTSVAKTAMAVLAFELWDDVIAINLNRVTSGGNVNFAQSTSTMGGGTYTQPYVNNDGSMAHADIWMNSTWWNLDQDSDITFGSSGFMAYLHEIGHALGLDHPGPYNITADYTSDAVYQQDTQRYTVMSYFEADMDGSATEHFGKTGNWTYAAAPMLHDIAVAQAMYGADMTTRAGNTVYGFGSTANRAVFNFKINVDPVVAIWDGGGKDTLNVSGYTTNQVIDLHAGSYSSIGYLTNNVAIAFGAVIENATGGSGNDTINGNSAINVLLGNDGNDTIFAFEGNDTLTGGKGNDTLDGGVGNDLLNGGAGNDLFFGGDGLDSVKLAGAASRFTVVHHTGYVTVSDHTGAEGTDTLYGIEKLVFVGSSLVL